MRDLLVCPSVALSNGNVADGRIKWGCPRWEVEEFEESAGKSGQGYSALMVGCQIGRVNCGKASLLQRISEH